MIQKYTQLLLSISLLNVLFYFIVQRATATTQPANADTSQPSTVPLTFTLTDLNEPFSHFPEKTDAYT